MIFQCTDMDSKLHNAKKTIQIIGVNVNNLIQIDREIKKSMVIMLKQISDYHVPLVCGIENILLFDFCQ